jgi:hypothetical protein
MDPFVDPFVVLALHLVALTSASGEIIAVNPEQVVSVRREPVVRQGHLSQHAHCMLNMTDGKFVAVQESCDEVEQRLQKNGWRSNKDEP